jgi:hypothetical protein
MPARTPARPLPPLFVLVFYTHTHNRPPPPPSHAQTGRVQVRTRALFPTEALVSAALDHASVRPPPDVGLLGGSGGSGGGVGGGCPPPHPVLAALAHTLSACVTLYPPRGVAGGADPTVVCVTGQGAVPALALASLARDYAFVRDAVVRAAHPAPACTSVGADAPAALAAAAAAADALPRAAGVTRALVGSLENAGLLDLAFFAAAGLPEGCAPGGGGGGGGGAEEEDGDGVGGGSRGVNFLDEFGHRARLLCAPFHWRASLACARGQYRQALWALLAEVPSLAGGVLEAVEGAAAGGGGDGAPSDDVALPLPHPASLLSTRCGLLARAAERGGDVRTALLALDVGGDYSGALQLLTRAGARALGVAAGLVGALAGAAADAARGGAPPPPTPPPTPHLPPLIAGGALPLAVLDTALGAISAAHKARAAPIALAAALLRGALRARFAAGAAAAEAAAAGGDGVDADDAAARAAAAWGAAGAPAGAPPVGGGGATWPPPAVAAALEGVSGARFEVYPPHAASGRPARVGEALLPLPYAHPPHGGPAPPPDGAPPRCPFAPLLSHALLAALARAGRRGGGGTGAFVNAAPAAAIFTGLTLRGGTLRPRRPPPLPANPPPLSFDTLQRWVGTVAAARRRGGRPGEGGGGAAGSGGGGEGGGGEEGAEGGLSLEALIAAAGGEHGVDGVTPGAFAEGVAVGRRRLRALPRGAEDAVVGYWRFEASEEELFARGGGGGGGGGARGAPPPATHDGLSLWATGAVRDLSKYGTHGFLFDGAAAGGARAQRVAWGACDAPLDPGDGVKVKPPRALVAGAEVSGAPGGADTLAGANCTPLAASLEPLAPWGAAFPFHRCTVGDVGVRPWDPVNAAFTLELWAKAGQWAAGGGGGGGGCGGGEEGAGGDARTPSTTGEGSPNSPPGGAPVVLAARAEYLPAARAHGVQWALSVSPDGAVAFESPALGAEGGGGGGGAPAALRSPPGAAPFGVWAHYAVTVDGGGAAKEAVARARANGAAIEAWGAAGGGGAPSLPFPPAAPGAPPHPPLPPLHVRLFVNGAQAAEGPVRAGEALPPHPLVGAPGGGADEALLLAPGAVARVAEVRLWAKRRSADELGDTKDFHLDLAQGKKMTISIKPARVPPTTTMTTKAAQPAATPAKAPAPATLQLATAAAAEDEAPPRRHAGLAAPPPPAGGGRLGLAAPPPPAQGAAKPRAGANPAAEGGAGAPPQPPAAKAADDLAPVAAPGKKPGALGGLAAPPPGVGGGKKAEMVRRAAAAAAAAAHSAPPP